MRGGEPVLTKVIFTPQANIDFAESLNWYAERDVATAERFQSQLDARIQELREHPDRWPKFDEIHRICTVKGFPFSIFYCVRDEDLIIAAIAHHSRSSNYWRKG